MIFRPPIRSLSLALCFLFFFISFVFSQPCANVDDADFRCKWVKKNPKKRCKKSATDATTYADHCPAACDTCALWKEDVIHVSSFGAVGDSHTDDTAAIRKAVSYAAAGSKNGGIVRLGRGVYRTFAPIAVPDGVRIVGEGYGASPLVIKFGGSVLAYCGTEHAVVLSGHNSGIERLAVYDWPYGEDCEGKEAAGGVLVDADARLVESVVVRDVLIYYFMGGTSLILRARNNGGIAYGSFYDLRVRHAKVGIHLVAEEGSFVNTNTFHAGAISGGIVQSALVAEGPGPCNDNKITNMSISGGIAQSALVAEGPGPCNDNKIENMSISGGIVQSALVTEGPGPCNDNKIENMSIEPPFTQDGHVLVRGYKTNLKMIGVRLEGNKNDPMTPMVHISDGSYDNVLQGLIGHTFVKADFNLNPDVTFLSYKGTNVRPHSKNEFHNSAFHGISFADDGTMSVPKWTWALSKAESPQILLSPSSQEIFPNHRVLNVTLSSGYIKFYPSSLDIPSIHQACSFGIYARASSPRAIVATMHSAGGGMVSSSGHTGSGNWEFVGQSGHFRLDGGPFPIFRIYANVELAAPAFSFGRTPPAPGFEPLSVAGGAVTGTLVTGMNTVPPPENYFWELPHEGNVFQMGEADGGVTVQRINGASESRRFPEGAVITVLLPEVGVTFLHGSYLKLKGNSNFSPTLPNSSITLVSLGKGTWREVNRND